MLLTQLQPFPALPVPVTGSHNFSSARFQQILHPWWDTILCHTLSLSLTEDKKSLSVQDLICPKTSMMELAGSAAFLWLPHINLLHKCINSMPLQKCALLLLFWRLEDVRDNYKERSLVLSHWEQKIKPAIHSSCFQTMPENQIVKCLDVWQWTWSGNFFLIERKYCRNIPLPFCSPSLESWFLTLLYYFSMSRTVNCRS